MDIVKVTRVLRVSAILLTLVVTILAAHPAAARPNNGSNKVPNLHARVGTFRSMCSDVGGSFSVSYSPNKATAKSASSTCKESETTTTCTFTNTTSSCKTTTKDAASAGPGSVAPVDDVGAMDIEITQTDPQVLPADNETLDTGEELTVDETVEAGDPIPQVIETEPAPIQPVDTEPDVIEATEDEDA